MLLRTQMAGLEFYDAILNNDLQQLKRLVAQHKLDLNGKFLEVRRKNDAGLCPIHLASIQGHTYMLQYLIKSKCDVNHTTGTLRRTALHFAVQSHKMACMLLLIAAGAKLDAKDTFGNTAFHYAADDGNYQILDVLIRRGVNVNSQDITSKTPLMKAVRNCNTDAALRLMRASADLNITDRNCDMALHYAARNGCVDISDILLSAGSVVDVQNYWGRSPLMEAVCYNHKEVVQLLLAACCDVNRREFKTGDTALHIAVKRNYTRVVELLLAAGSRHDIYNHQGETAVHEAVSGNKMDIAQLMLVYNVDLEVPVKYFPTGEYKSVFKLAAERGHYKICRIFAKVGYLDYSARVFFHPGYHTQSRLGEHDQLLLLLRSSMKTVLPLQQLCRNVIRRHAGHNLWEKVESLPVPRALKDYVLLKDLLELRNESCA